METGRKPKNNISYYRHSTNSHQHPKFAYLRERYGWEGEGRFWALNNLIADHDECRLPIGKKFEVAGYAKTLDMSEADFSEYLRFLIEDCNLIIRDGDYITTKKVQEVLQSVKGKSASNQKFYQSRREFKTTESQIKTTESDLKATESNLKDAESDLKLFSSEPKIDPFSPRVDDLVKEVMRYFNFNELNHFTQMREISTFLNVLHVTNRLTYFETQFEYYRKHRDVAKIGKHNIRNFIGTSEQRFSDGAWNAENWKEKYREYVSKANKTETDQPVKGRVIKEWGS